MNNRIIYIDDNIDDDDPLVLSLKDEEFEVKVLKDSKNALEYIKTRQYDIVLLDLDMGARSTSGNQLFNEIRKVDEKVPVVIISAYIKINHYSNSSRENAYNQFLKPMFHVYGNEWDGSIHEIFDGDPIFEPHGCINQAWSVAEILRAWVEDILVERPVYEKKYNLNKIRV